MFGKRAKKITKNITARNWTSAEVTLIAEVLGDEEHNLLLLSKNLPWNEAGNNKVSTLPQKIFDHKRRENYFIEFNEVENFTNAKRVVSKYTPLDTSLQKLRRKYTTLKAEWRKISDRCKNGLV